MAHSNSVLQITCSQLLIHSLFAHSCLYIYYLSSSVLDVNAALYALGIASIGSASNIRFYYKGSRTETEYTEQYEDTAYNTQLHACPLT